VPVVFVLVEKGEIQVARIFNGIKFEAFQQMLACELEHYGEVM
jgi:hypothetical protein